MVLSMTAPKIYLSRLSLKVQNPTAPVWRRLAEELVVVIKRQGRKREQAWRAQETG